MVGVVVLHFVSRALLLHGHSGCRVMWPWWASCHVAMVGVVALHFVSWVPSLRGRGGRCVAVMFVVWPRWVSLRRVVSQLGLLRGCGGCHCTAWDRGDWTTKEEISRKKRKEKKKNAPEGTPARVAQRCPPCISHRHIVVVSGGAMVHPGGW